MARSRSSFELTVAIKQATQLGPHEEPSKAPFEGVALVSFDQQIAATQAVPVLPGSGMPSARVPTPQPMPRVTQPPAEELEREPPSRRPDQFEDGKRPPKLPDLTGVVSPGVRCERIVEWIIEATGATEVFLADSNGLPIAGAVNDVEAKLAGSGLVAASIASLATSIPGNLSRLFEVHIGEGPFLQLIGFPAGQALFLVGLTRGTPLTPRQAHAIRLACRHALGDTLGGPA